MTLAKTIIYGSLEQVAGAIRTVEHVNYIDEYGFTPLIQTCIVNDIEKTKLLLQHQADPNQQDLVGGTALHWAIENSNFELCQLLLEHKADPNLCNYNSQPPLAKTLLRNQTDLKNLLRQHGASLIFAQDFINAKMLGHMFELNSTVDIVDPSDRFCELSFEGFYLEFTVEAIRRSLRDFQYNFAARQFHNIFSNLQSIINALRHASQLTKYQQYLIDIKNHQQEIHHLLSFDPLIVPITQEGHALTLVRHGALLAICDRASRGEKDDQIKIYYMNKPKRLDDDLLRQLIYKVNSLDVYHHQLPRELALQPIATLPLNPQLAGNCTWANVEACIPALYFMFELNSKNYKENLVNSMDQALNLFYEWREWEKDRSLHRCIADFYTATPARKASKAAILAAILFQRCHAEDPKGIERAMKLIPVLKTKGYEYTYENYLQSYFNTKQTAAGKNLQKLLSLHDIIGV